MRLCGKRILSVGLALLVALTFTWQTTVASPLEKTSVGSSLGRSDSPLGDSSDDSPDEPPDDSSDESSDNALGTSEPEKLVLPMAAFAPVNAQVGVLQSVEMESILYAPEKDSFHITETIRVIFTLESNTGLVPGSKTNIQFPPELQVLHVPEFDIRNADNSDRVIARGTVNTASNSITITATEATQNAISVKGFVRLSATFNETEINSKWNKNNEDAVNVTFTFSENFTNYNKSIDLPKEVTTKKNNGSYYLFYKQGKVVDDLRIWWHIGVNYYWYQEQDLYDLKNVIIEDTIAAGHELVEGSLEVWEVSWVIQGPNGLIYTGSPTDKTKDPNTNLDVKNPSQFTLSLGDIGAKPYRITYYTTMTDPENHEIYRNTANMTGRAGSTDLSRTSTNQVVYSYSSGAEDKYIDADLTLKKIDGDTKKPLSGAMFELYNGDGALMTTRSTDQNGVIKHGGRVKLDEVYTLKEVRTPGAEYEPITKTFVYKKTKDKDGKDIIVDGDGNEVLVKKDNNIEVIVDTITIENFSTKKTGILEIRKVDEEGFRLSGATFFLYKDAAATMLVTDKYGNSQWTTGADGQQPGYARIEGIPVGNYYLLEAKAPTGYIREANPIPVEVLDNASGITQIKLENKRDKLDMTIIKEDDKDQTRLTGANFTAYRKSPSQKWTEVKTFTIDSTDGYRIPAIVGEYRLWENTAPAGYKPLNKYIEFEITQQDKLHGSYMLFVPNEKKEEDSGGTTETRLASVQAYTHDEQDRNKGLEGAELVLHRVSESTGEITRVLTGGTGKSGVISDLEFGTYQFIPETPPDGYTAVEKYKSFELTEENTVEGPKVVDLPYRPEQGTLEILKYDSETGEALPNAAFTLEYEDERDYFVNKLTGSDGKITVSGIPYGTYRLWETRAPEGYYTGGGYTEVVLDRKTVTVRVPNKAVEDDAKVGNITLIKTARENQNTFLPGAEFDLDIQDGSGWTDYLHGLITDSTGKISIHDLPEGKYRFREIAAPEGYEISAASENIPFEVKAEKDETLHVSNPKSADNGGGDGDGGSEGGGDGDGGSGGSGGSGGGSGGTSTSRRSSRRSSGTNSGSGAVSRPPDDKKTTEPTSPSDVKEDPPRFLASSDNGNPNMGAAVHRVLLGIALGCIVSGAALLLTSRKER